MDNKRDYEILNGFADAIKDAICVAQSYNVSEECNKIIDEELEEYEAPGDTWFVTVARSNIPASEIKYAKPLKGSGAAVGDDTPFNLIVESHSGRESPYWDKEIITSVKCSGENAGEAFIKAFAIITKFLEEQNESKV